jgi:hypothetical protein
MTSCGRRGLVRTVATPLSFEPAWFVRPLEKLAPEARRLKDLDGTVAVWDGLADNLGELENLTADLTSIPYDVKEANKGRKRYDELVDERAELLARRPEFAAGVTEAKGGSTHSVRSRRRDRSMTRSKQ